MIATGVAQGRISIGRLKWKVTWLMALSSTIAAHTTSRKTRDSVMAAVTTSNLRLIRNSQLISLQS